MKFLVWEFLECLGMKEEEQQKKAQECTGSCRERRTCWSLRVMCKRGGNKCCKLCCCCEKSTSRALCLVHVDVWWRWAHKVERNLLIVSR